MISWLKQFNYYVGKTLGRKVFLLWDNFEAHGNEETLPDLDYVVLGKHVYKIAATSFNFSHPVLLPTPSLW